jgi:hypothetical protein
MKQKSKSGCSAFVLEAGWSTFPAGSGSKSHAITISPDLSEYYLFYAKYL